MVPIFNLSTDGCPGLVLDFLKEADVSVHAQGDLADLVAFILEHVVNYIYSIFRVGELGFGEHFSLQVLGSLFPDIF
jgi:hypothetical protein